MFCPKCGKEIGTDEQFCWNCGTENLRFTPDTPKEQPTVQPDIPKEPSFFQAEVPKQQSFVQSFSEKNTERKEEVISDEYDYRSIPSKEESGIKSFYIVDFLSRLAGKSNIPLCIYLVLNVVIIGLICSLLLALPIGWGLLSGAILYGASVTIALSPIGEFMIRNQNNCREIMDVELVNRLNPIFREVYYKARQENPSISKDVRLFINEDESANAFATGRKTVCLTRGMLEADDETIKAVLAHEFGHLSHKDTDRILVVNIGNVVITAIATFFQVGVIVTHFFMSIVALFMDAEDGFWFSIFNTIGSIISLIFVRGLMRVWTALGTALCMKTSRGNEYEADHFAFKLGYGITLANFLGELPSVKPKGLFASLANSHPASEDRVERLLELVEEAA